MQKKGSRAFWAVFTLVALGSAGLVAGCGEATKPVGDESEVSAEGGTTEASGGADTGSGTGSDTGTETEQPAIGENTTDIAVVRLTADGQLDPTFGESGIAVFDFGTNAGRAGDSVWSIAGDPQGRVVLFGNKRGEGDRLDADRIVARLTPQGALDQSFANEGVQTLDIANLNDNARHGFIQTDGKIVASGYTAQPTGVGTQAANHIVLQRLLEDGSPDTTFGYQGVVNVNPFTPEAPGAQPWGMAEAYGVAYVDGRYVTTGYGRAASTGPVDLVSVGFGDNGAIDRTFGIGGVAVLDVIGESDRGRQIIPLTGGRTLHVGSGVQSSGNNDALAFVLDADGQPDSTFTADGHRLFELGRSDDAFFAAAAAPTGDGFVAAGHSAGQRAGVVEDDDSLLVVFPALSAEPIVKVVALSEEHPDRFAATAYDAQGRIYAAGYVQEGDDSRMVVARFTNQGEIDPSFGDNGIATINVVEGEGAESARGLVIQLDGRIVIAGAVAHR